MKQQIEGILDVRSAPAFARIASELRPVASRGAAASTSSSTRSISPAVGCTCSRAVLERFFGLYASLNSFSHPWPHGTRQRKGVLREWTPRAGWKPLL